MGKGFDGVVLRGLGAREHRMTVTTRHHLAEHVVRVGLHSDTLLDAAGEAPANWVRAWFPDPQGRSREHQRGYTLVDPDPATGRFSLDFVLHEPAGPASAWASRCVVGDQITAMRYGEKPFALLEPPPAGYLLMGDVAAYPALSALAASIPLEHRVVVHLERHDARDEQLPLPAGPNVAARWVDELPDGQGLAASHVGADWRGWYAWVTAEATATRRARAVLQREHGLQRRQLHTQAYWSRGRAMGRRSGDEG